VEVPRSRSFPAPKKGWTVGFFRTEEFSHVIALALDRFAGFRQNQPFAEVEVNVRVWSGAAAFLKDAKWDKAGILTAFE
jgi:hypothetical protein